MGERRQDLVRARLLLGGRHWMTDENPVACDRVTRPLHVERTGDGDAGDALEVRRHHVVADPFDDAFLEQRIFQERRCQLSPPGFHRHADLEMRVGRRSAAEHHLLRVGRDGEELEPAIVEPEIELAFPLEAQIFVVSVPAQGHRDLVFAVHRKQVLDDCAAARANGRGLARTIGLNEPMRHVIGLIGHGQRGIAHRSPADLACR
jgi:hypothetical protein